MLADPCPSKTRADLEWDRLLGALAERCSIPAGQRLARSLPFASSIEEIRVRLAEVRESVELEAAADPLPVPSLPDVDNAIERARIGAALAIDELRGLARVLEAARALRRYLHARRDRCPSLNDACATDPSLDELLVTLSAAFDPEDRKSTRLNSSHLG